MFFRTCWILCDYEHHMISIIIFLIFLSFQLVGDFVINYGEIRSEKFNYNFPPWKDGNFLWYYVSPDYLLETFNQVWSLINIFVIIWRRYCWMFSLILRILFLFSLLTMCAFIPLSYCNPFLFSHLKVKINFHAHLSFDFAFRSICSRMYSGMFSYVFMFVARPISTWSLDGYLSSVIWHSVHANVFTFKFNSGFYLEMNILNGKLTTWPHAWCEEIKHFLCSKNCSELKLYRAKNQSGLWR